MLHFLEDPIVAGLLITAAIIVMALIVLVENYKPKWPRRKQPSKKRG